MLCPGSVRLTRDLPETSSAAADEGTLAHSIAAVCITSRTPVDHHPMAGDLEDLCEGNIEALQTYVDYAISLVDEPGVMPYVEQTFRLDHVLGEEAFGTSDLCVVKGKQARVVDLKFGKGNVVYASYRINGVMRPNPQLVLYGLGVLEKLAWLVEDVDEVVLEIFQPRRNHRSEVIVPIAEMLEEKGRFAKVAEVTRRPDAPLIPGEAQCQWCPVRATCAVRSEWVIESFQTEVAFMNPHELAHHLEKVDAIRAWCNDLEELATARLQRDPKSIPDWKLVEGMSRRKWRPDAMSILKDHDDLFVRQLVTLGAAEKLMGKDSTLLASALEKPRGKPTLAPASDPRPALIDTPLFD
jgi:hypothetical protein